MEQQTSLTSTMHIDAKEQQSRKTFVDFTDRDAKCLHELLPLIKSHARRIVDIFYTNIERYPDLMAIIDGAGSNIDRLKKAQQQYLLEMFSGTYDETYFERRLRIGVIHNKINLTPRWYIGSYSVYNQEIVPLIIQKYRFRPFKRNQVLAAVNKIISLDSQLAMDTYIHGLMNDLQNVNMSKSEIEDRVNVYSAFIEQVANGDLRKSLDVQGDDGLSRLGHNLNSMTKRLEDMAREILRASHALSSTLNQVQATINNQNALGAEQASAVNEITSTLEEIKATSQQTHEKAKLLGESAETTRNESEQGQQALDATIEGMNSIRDQVQGIAQPILALSEQTQQIGEITDAVNLIAQQSKMLALNASIEAAKAGEAGKGFAVVAAEVKGLAEQSQESTNQVQQILQEIRQATDRAVMSTEEGIKGVDTGASLVTKSSDAMRNLRKVVHETTTAGQQIVAAVNQEAAGIDQVTTAMREINKATIEFVSSTKQTTTASEDLMDLAKNLNQSVSVYKLNDIDSGNN